MYGSAIGDTVSNGGTQTVYSGGKMSATTVLSGGTATVLRGATATSTTVSAGGLLIVSGGTVSGVRLASGGGIEIEGLTFVSGATATLSGTTLKITNNGSSTYISGFTEVTSGALQVTAAASGLVITQGAVTSTISAHLKVADVRPTGATSLPLAATTTFGVGRPSVSSLVQKGGAVAHYTLSQNAPASMGFLQGMALPLSAMTSQLHTLVVAHAAGYSLAGVTLKPTVMAMGGSRLVEHFAVVPAGLRSPGGADR